MTHIQFVGVDGYAFPASSLNTIGGSRFSRYGRNEGCASCKELYHVTASRSVSISSIQLGHFIRKAASMTHIRVTASGTGRSRSRVLIV